MTAIKKNQFTEGRGFAKAGGKESSLTGTIADHETRLTALEVIDESVGGPTISAELSMDTTSPPTATAGRGVVLGTGAEGQVTQLAVAALAVRVQTAGTAINNQGKEIALPTTTSLAIATADLANNRKDIVVLTSAGKLAVRKGTAAGSPVDPTLTAGDVPLARVAVAANAVTILTANITDLRSRGGVSGANLTPGSVPASKLSMAGIKTGTFAGKNGTGAITLTGVVVGDRVEFVQEIALVSNHLVEGLGAVTTQPNALFESVVTVNDQIQQASASDLSTKVYLVRVIPAAV